ncbi:MAG: response regulator transcription factor [Elusimicrobiota bacterium]
MKRIAVIEDEQDLADLLKFVFQKANYAVKTFPTVGKFLDGMGGFVPDLTIIDLMLPTISGWELISFLRGRAETRTIPMIVCSGRYKDSKDVVRALDLGADEFFPKPVSPEILLARAEALLRRFAWGPAMAAPEPHEQVRVGRLTIDETEHAVTLGGRDIPVTALEFDLLNYLVRNKNHVLTRGLLLEHVWKSDPGQATRTVDKRIESLRKKLGDFGRRIETISRVGYVLKI